MSILRMRLGRRRLRLSRFSHAFPLVRPSNGAVCALSTCRSAQSSEIDCAMRTTIAARANLELIDQNYARWQEDPASVDPSWAAFFEGFELGNLPQRNGAAATTAQRSGLRESPLQTRIDGLVYAYRT